MGGEQKAYQTLSPVQKVNLVQQKIFKIDAVTGIMDVSQFAQPVVHEIRLAVLQGDGSQPSWHAV